MIIFICFSLLLGFLKEYTFDLFSSDDGNDDDDDVSDMDIDSSEESDEEMEEEPDIDAIESGRSKLNEAQLEHNKGTPPKDNVSLGELQGKYSKQLKNTDSVQDFLDNVDKKLTSDVEIIKKKYNYTEEELAESEEEKDPSKDESKDESKDKSEAEKKREESNSTRGSRSFGFPFGGSGPGSSGPGGSAPSGSSGTSSGPSQGSSSGGTLSKVIVGLLGLLGSLAETISNFF